jgi:hypothetical protein
LKDVSGIKDPLEKIEAGLVMHINKFTINN